MLCTTRYASEKENRKSAARTIYAVGLAFICVGRIAISTGFQEFCNRECTRYLRGHVKPYLSLSTWSEGDIDEAARVELALVCAALRSLRLLLGFDLGSLRLDLAWKGNTMSASW